MLPLEHCSLPTDWAAGSGAPPGSIATDISGQRSPNPAVQERSNASRRMLIRTWTGTPASARICRMYDEKPKAGGWTAYASEDGAESQGISKKCPGDRGPGRSGNAGLTCL